MKARSPAKSARMIALALGGVIFLLAAPGMNRSAVAQSIKVNVQPRHIGIEDVVRVEMRLGLEGEADEYQEPSLEDWVVRDQSTSRFTSITNGVVRKERIYNLTLEPRRAGTLVIGAAHLLRKGQVVASSPRIEVAVTEQDAVTSTVATDLSAHRNESIFILPHLSKTRPYEGEPLVLSFNFYIQSRLRFQEKGVKIPDLSGFAVTDVGPRKAVKRRQRIGRTTYNVFTIKRDILVPLNAGIQSVDPLRITLLVFETFNQRQVNAKSSRFEIEVRPIPEEGRPDSYRSGNLGSFTISAALENPEIRLGKRGILTVTISGKGNLRSIKEPVLPNIPGLDIERLEGEEMKKVVEDATGMHGQVVFTYMVTPRRVATIEIPPIRLGYFDPDKESFSVTRSKPLQLGVPQPVGVDVPGDDPASTRKGEHRKTPQVTSPGGATVLYPITVELETPALAPQTVPTKEPFFPTPVSQGLFWFILVFPPTLLLLSEGVVLSRRWRKEAAPQRREKHAIRRALSALRGLAKRAQPESVQFFYEEVNHIVTTFLADRFGLPANTMTRLALRESLNQRGFSNELISKLITEMENCDFARYAPASTRGGEMRDCLERTKKLLSQLENTPKEASDAS